MPVTVPCHTRWHIKTYSVLLFGHPIQDWNVFVELIKVKVEAFGYLTVMILASIVLS